MKTCTKCMVEKPVDRFAVNRHAKSGVRSACKSCGNLSSKAWRKANPEKHADANRAWNAANPVKKKASCCAWRSANMDRYVAKNLVWREANPDKVLANQRACTAANPKKHADTQRAWRMNNPVRLATLAANRRAKKAKATPGWFSDFDSFVVEEAYDLSARRRVATGIDWQLDHVVPIAGKKVCGLHVALNLQLLPAVMNNRKHNRHAPQTFDPRTRSLFQGVTV